MPQTTTKSKQAKKKRKVVTVTPGDATSIPRMPTRRSTRRRLPLEDKNDTGTTSNVNNNHDQIQREEESSRPREEQQQVLLLLEEEQFQVSPIRHGAARSAAIFLFFSSTHLPIME
jgi:hypothetical protein